MSAGNRNDEFHLVIYWSEADGFTITEMEPSSEGWIWNEDNAQWRNADEPGDSERFAWMVEQIAKLNEEVEA